ncbi:MAG: HU family DNA-binding protein [Candidatus Moraniibacteriota bacterium]
MNKSTFVAAVAAKTDMSKADTERFLEAFIDEVTSQLQARNEVAFTGFGTFSTSDRKARQGVNPKTGEKIQIAATTVPKFKAGKGLKDAVKA